MNTEYKSYARVCWRLWFILFIGFFLGKIFKIHILKGIPFFLYWFVITFSFVIVIALIAQGKLLNYLKKNHYEKWEEITTIPNLGSGLYNGPRLSKFLKSEYILNDPTLVKLKSEFDSIYLLTIIHVSFIIPFSLVDLLLFF